MATKKEPRRGIQLGQTAMGLPVKAGETVPVSKGFKAGVNGLSWEGSPSFESWAEAGKVLRVIERGAQFAIGDFLNYGEDRFNERASQVVDASEGWSEKTCSVYRWLASRIAQGNRRMDRLTIAHHLLVAALSPSRQKHWLTRAADDAEEKPWTVGRLRAALQDGEDMPVTGWWCLVLCKDQGDQTAFQDAMEAQGRTCKAVMKRDRKKRELEATA
jgi:hypothetical protein